MVETTEAIPLSEEETHLVRDIVGELDAEKMSTRMVVSALASSTGETEESYIPKKTAIFELVNQIMDELEDREEAKRQEQDETYEEGEKKEKKKKEKKEHKKKKKKHKHSRKNEQDEEEEQEEKPKKRKKKKEEEEEEDRMPSSTQEKKSDDPFERVLQGMKTRRKKLDIPIAELERQAMDIVSKINVAADDDTKLMSERKPATNRLRALPEVCSALRNRDLSECLLENGVLDSLARWLRPLPDGTLPSLNIRTEILGLLRQLPVDPQRHLKENGIGSVIRMLANSKAETPANRTIARELYDSWTRTLFELSSSYRDLERAQLAKIATQQQQQQQQLPPPPSAGATALAKQKETRSVLEHAWVGDGKRAFIPAKDAMEFVRRPKPEPVREAPIAIVAQFERKWKTARRNSDLTKSKK